MVSQWCISSSVLSVLNIIGFNKLKYKYKMELDSLTSITETREMLFYSLEQHKVRAAEKA